MRGLGLIDFKSFEVSQIHLSKLFMIFTPIVAPQSTNRFRTPIKKYLPNCVRDFRRLFFRKKVQNRMYMAYACATYYSCSSLVAAISWLAGSSGLAISSFSRFIISSLTACASCLASFRSPSTLRSSFLVS